MYIDKKTTKNDATKLETIPINIIKTLLGALGFSGMKGGSTYSKI
jgi:hypothetical protein